MSEKQKVTIKFAGGALSPTGSNFIVTVNDKKIMIDCGLYQGGKVISDKNFVPFDYDAKSIDILFVTHAHLDHVGRIPKLVRDGFRGVIMSTAATRDIAELIMLDSINIIQKEREHNEEHYTKEKQGEIFFEEKDVLHAINLWKVIDYHEPIVVKTSHSDVEIEYFNSGHILGSAMINLKINNKNIMFTGDLGNSPSPLLPDTEKIENIDYLIIESVYGDRNHEDKSYRVQKFKKVVKDSIKKNGTLMIPAFSIERTQEIVYYLNEMIENGEIDPLPVYLDSPLAIHITSIYKKYKNLLRKEVEEQIKSGDDIFKFPKFVETLSKEDSINIKNISNPKIIIAGSGMSVGGRIVHHEFNYLGDKDSTILLVGYQSTGSLGRQIQDGNKFVRIHGQDVQVKCKVENIGGFSAHKDSDNLVSFVSGSSLSLQKVFVVLGEQGSALHLAQRIRENFFIDVIVPEDNDEVEIEL